MTPAASNADTVFFFDCDNTLLDNDRVHDDLQAWLEQRLGPEGSAGYWMHYEQLRQELGYADYLGAVQRLRLGAPHDMRALQLSTYLLDYPFRDRVYPGALETVGHCRGYGLTVMLSDGDAVFQPHKLQRAGLWQAVEGRVLIYVHKEQMLEQAKRSYPARHYVVVDDKLRLLSAMKALLQDSLTTVWPRQGHYAQEAANLGYAADLAIGRIGDLLQYDFSNPAQPEHTCPPRN